MCSKFAKKAKIMNNSYEKRDEAIKAHKKQAEKPLILKKTIVSRFFISNNLLRH